MPCCILFLAFFGKGEQTLSREAAFSRASRYRRVGIAETVSPITVGWANYARGLAEVVGLADNPWAMFRKPQPLQLV